MLIRQAFLRWLVAAVVVLPVWLGVGWAIFGGGGWGTLGLIVTVPVAFLSLGTGEMTRPIMYEEAKGWGLAKWAQPILSVVSDGVSDTVNYQVKSLLEIESEEPNSYLRIQAPLHEGNDDMDYASRTNLKVLKLLAKDLMSEHGDELDDFAERLVR